MVFGTGKIKIWWEVGGEGVYWVGNFSRWGEVGGGRMSRFSAGGLKNFLTDYHLSHISQTSIYKKKMIAVIIALR